MEKTMVQMALAVKEADDDTKLIEVADPWLQEYAHKLVDSLNKVTEILGPGWAKDMASTKRATLGKERALKKALTQSSK